MYTQIKKEVEKLLSTASGHGLDHVERVCQTALWLAKKENVDEETVMLAALLHDVDDYKFVGIEQAKNLLNAKKIMQKAGISAVKQEIVCDIILNMGYSKALKGIRPKTKEGAIVSDADMLDAMGAVAVVRTLEYALLKGGFVFDKDIFPETKVSFESYQKKATIQEPAINHFFDKLLKLNGLIITESAKKEAQKRHDFMVAFLKEFFLEQNQKEWLDYLELYLNRL